MENGMTWNGSHPRRQAIEPAETPDFPDDNRLVPSMGHGAAGEGSRSRLATLSALRQVIGRIEGVPFAHEPSADQDEKPKDGDRFALGAPLFDAALGGGLPRAGLLELRTHAMRDGGAGVGFALALGLRLGACRERPLLWIAAADALAEGGMPYREGLAHFGFDPEALVVVRARRVVDAAWAGEEAARSGASALTVVELRGNPALLGLEGTRRLHTRARDASGAVVLLRQGGEAEASAAPVRLLVKPVRAAPVPGLEALPLIGRPRFSLGLEKARGLSPRTLQLEWDPHDRRFLDHDLRFVPAGRVPGPAAAPAGERPDPARGTGSLLALRPLRPGLEGEDAPRRRAGTL
jgi:protein ImuA